MQRSPALLAALFCLGTSSAVQAEPASAYAPFVGTYHNLALDDARSEVDQAIERGVRAMSFVVRPIARRRLQDVNPTYESIRISERGDELVTDYEGRRYSAGVDGLPRRNVDPDGSAVMVSYQLLGDTLRARYVSEDGEKRYAFRRAASTGELDVHVTVLSPRLPKPISYDMRYAREP